MRITMYNFRCKSEFFHVANTKSECPICESKEIEYDWWQIQGRLHSVWISNTLSQGFSLDSFWFDLDVNSKNDLIFNKTTMIASLLFQNDVYDIRKLTLFSRQSHALHRFAGEAYSDAMYKDAYLIVSFQYLHFELIHYCNNEYRYNISLEVNCFCLMSLVFDLDLLDMFKTTQVLVPVRILGSK